MSTPAIITVAITGSQPSKAQNPAVPTQPAEQIESTHEAFEAGASLVHIHVRDDQDKSCSDVVKFRQVQEGIAKHCPGMIIQFSTGGRGRDASERGSALSLKPDMGSLATGSVNFATIIYENPPQLIDDLANDMIKFDVKPECELFDLAMLYNAKVLVELYRVAFDPLKEISFISDEYNKFELEGSLLADTTKPYDAVLGQFGRIVQL